MRKKNFVTMYQDETFHTIPDFSFGTKAIIRPLPTTTNSVVSTVRTLSELSNRFKAAIEASVPEPSSASPMPNASRSRSDDE